MKIAKKVKTLLSISLVAILLSAQEVCASSEDIDVHQEEQSQTAYDMLIECEDELAKLSTQNVDVSKKVEVLSETRDALVEKGYVAYIVSPDNYHELQEVLSVSFEDLGFSPECTYLIVDGDLSGGDMSVNSSYSSPFTYTYGGTTYTMKYMTVTAADDSDYAKADSVNVLTSASKNLIQNCLDTSIQVYLSSIWTPLGAVASICGLSVSNFGTAQTSTLNLNGGANWTRIYTLVYSSSDATWYKGSCVESVYVLSYMSGMYYNASTNAMTAVPTNASGATRYSSNYSNTTWRKQYAAIYYSNGSGCCYDTVGNVPFYYGSTKKFTLYENF